MEQRTWIGILFFLATLPFVTPASAQQRIDFERKKFDRSRFERPDPSVRPPVPDSPAAAPATPYSTATVTPAAPAVSSNTPEFSFATTNPAPSEPAVPPDAASTGTSSFSSNSVPAPYPPSASSYPANATPEEKALIDAPLLDQIPAKWFDSPKDHAELLDLQKKTGACMLVYFRNLNVSNEKGLCSWFEKGIMNSMDWRKAMKNYIKLEITVAGGNDTLEALIAEYRANKTPAVFVVKPGSRSERLQVFSYTNGSKPELVDIAVVLQNLKAHSTPAYQTLF